MLGREQMVTSIQLRVQAEEWDRHVTESHPSNHTNRGQASRPFLQIPDRSGTASERCSLTQVGAVFLQQLAAQSPLDPVNSRK